MSNEASTTVMSKRHSEDCLPCRLVSGFGVIGIGGYLLLSAKKCSPGWSRNMVNVISIGTFGIGVTRLLDLPPFRKTTNKQQ